MFISLSFILIGGIGIVSSFSNKATNKESHSTKTQDKKYNQVANIDHNQDNPQQVLQKEVNQMVQTAIDWGTTFIFSLATRIISFLISIILYSFGSHYFLLSVLMPYCITTIFYTNNKFKFLYFLVVFGLYVAYFKQYLGIGWIYSATALLTFIGELPYVVTQPNNQKIRKISIAILLIGVFMLINSHYYQDIAMIQYHATGNIQKFQKTSKQDIYKTLDEYNVSEISGSEYNITELNENFWKQFDKQQTYSFTTVLGISVMLMNTFTILSCFSGGFEEYCKTQNKFQNNIIMKIFVKAIFWVGIILLQLFLYNYISILFVIINLIILPISSCFLCCNCFGVLINDTVRTQSMKQS